MDKPNYNDGNWHGWAGGDCPVHPESEIQAVRGSKQGATVVTWKAKEFQHHCWTVNDGINSIIAFRVTRENREPRRFWIGLVSGVVSNRQQLGMIEVIEVMK
jgi:hypothetical protein